MSCPQLQKGAETHDKPKTKCEVHEGLDLGPLAQGAEKRNVTTSERQDGKGDAWAEMQDGQSVDDDAEHPSCGLTLELSRHGEAGRLARVGDDDWLAHPGKADCLGGSALERPFRPQRETRAARRGYRRQQAFDGSRRAGRRGESSCWIMSATLRRRLARCLAR